MRPRPDPAGNAQNHNLSESDRPTMTSLRLLYNPAEELHIPFTVKGKKFCQGCWDWVVPGVPGDRVYASWAVAEKYDHKLQGASDR